MTLKQADLETLLREQQADRAELLRQHAALQASKARLEMALHAATMGIWDFDLNTGRVDWAGESAPLFGITLAEFGGTLDAVQDCVHPDDREQGLEVFRRTVEEGADWDNTYRVIWPDGSIHWLHSYGRLIRDADGKPQRILGTTRDVTQYKQAECQLLDMNRQLAQASLKAEAANRAKSAFLANMSHEIRTPLNAIIGFARIFERDSKLDPQQLRQVQTIARSGEHLLMLINDILELSRIESGRLELHPIDCDLHELLDDLEQMFRLAADAKGLWLQIERPDHHLRYLHTDAFKLRQILINLLGNAVKFTRKGGVTVRVQAVAASPEPSYLLLEVTDTGVGIAEQDHQRIFDAFQQGDQGYTTGGTGLGLAISRRLAVMMGGDLTIDSQLGQGSRFQLRLPLTLAQSPSMLGLTKVNRMDRVVAVEPDGGSQRLLVVDDFADNRNLLSDLLTPLGFEIIEATNGQEAVEMFAQTVVRAVFMDLRMPVMDGYDAIQRLKAMPAGQTTPVIILTASAFDEQRTQALATGADAYLSKPFQPDELLAVLAEVAGLRYRFAEAHQVTEPERHLDAAALADIPTDLCLQLCQAVAQGDMEQIKALVSQVAAHNPAVARSLDGLAANYDYDMLIHLLSSARN